LKLSSHTYYLFVSSRSRHTRSKRDWSSDVCSSDLVLRQQTWILLPWRFFQRRCSPLASDQSLHLSAYCVAFSNKVLSFLRHQERSEERRVGKESRYWWLLRQKTKTRSCEQLGKYTC